VEVNVSASATERQKAGAGAGIDYVARARALIPTLEAAGPRIDALRELPPDLLATMHDAGVFRTLLPRSLGGGEVHPATFVQVTEAIAMGDGSAAWSLGQNSGCSMTAAYLAPKIAREIWGPQDGVLAWGFGPNGNAVEVEGGYRVTGRWSFASGSRHATWMGGHSVVCTPDGAPRLDEEGNPIERTMLFPRASASFIDDWQVVGLRGTGSDSYMVRDLFVPAAYSTARDTEQERREPGTLYRFTSLNLYASGFAGVAMGLARAMLNKFIAMAQDKIPQARTVTMRNDPVIQSKLGFAEARLRAARTHLLQSLREIYDDVEQTGAGELSVEQRIIIRMASTYAIHEARDVADLVWQEAGSTAVFEKNPFERRFRDIHTVTQQAQGRPAHFETVGQHFLGLPAKGRFL
jgi:alkylation response protein AidB-like acyl-CoA dehydrogenase